MEKEEVELLPSGLISCTLDRREVRILKISPERLTVRLAEKIDKINLITVMFYAFNENRYEEVIIKDYKIIEIVKDEFYYTYVFSVKDHEYLNNVRRIFKSYLNYIMLKEYGYENEFSKEMVNYPAESDNDFYKYYDDQKKDWIKELKLLDFNEDILKSAELAISLDNGILYRKYMDSNIKDFKTYYFKKNFIEKHKFFLMEIKRLYIGNEFCHNLFPDVNLLISIMNKAKEEGLQITVCFTYMRDNYIEKTKSILEEIYKWCCKNSTKIEIVINDFGMLKLTEDKLNFFKISLGVLLNKRKKDPRYIYKKGLMENKELMAKNSLNSFIFNKFLKDLNIMRYEYESCGYKMKIAEGHHSMHIPFYQTNTSQYCPLYAVCKKFDRGEQELVYNCPNYCKDYVLLYPKHLKMVGRYNSLFAFDDTCLNNSKSLEYYLNNGIDRIVLNFI